MEEQERSRCLSRRTSRVEQVVGRWLRRSRDSSSRERTLGDGLQGEPTSSDHRNFPIRVTVQIARDPVLDSHGFNLSIQPPVLVQDVVAEGPAEGRLVPGDHVLRINNVLVDDLSAEQAADIIRELQDTVTITVLRHTVGPKSSFISEEKRARLRTNPVKVRFAEEVVVNGHSQGNSLLFLPNVLKVYLENGQTKAFKFEAKTTVKDIVLTLKEKLSIRCIEHFALVLEQQYSVTKLFLLHEEEFIQQVVQRREPYDYRCLFRVCFMPRDPLDLLQEDPVAFEYLYLQSVCDVLQERFAVEMKCNTALRLAALHARERLLSCGQMHKASFKSITKNWGIENFVSPTLLRNMREKELMKAISYHMKKTQALQEPRQKVITATQARLNYLAELGELRSYSGKSFSATMMLQDRESMVSLLVGAKYGISQMINHKLNIMTTLAEFASISRVELLPESDKVSLVKIYLQDIKVIMLMLEAQAAKELSCLVAGYCRLLSDPTVSYFSLIERPKEHRISAEEGYVSRGCSDSEESSELDSTDTLITPNFSSDDMGEVPASVQGQQDRWKTQKGSKDEEAVTGQEVVAMEAGERERVEGGEAEGEGHEGEDAPSEAWDSCNTDSHFNVSYSSDSMDALEEDDLIACSSSCISDHQGHHLPYLQNHSETITSEDPAGFSLANGGYDGDPFVCFARLSRMVDALPSPPAASEEDEEDQGLCMPPQRDCMFNFEESDARHYYNICSNVTPDSAHSLPKPQLECALEEEDKRGYPRTLEPAPVLQPPPGFEDSSSDDEFFDAHDRFASPEVVSAVTTEKGAYTDRLIRTLSLGDIEITVPEEAGEMEQKSEQGGGSRLRKKSRKRRSFVVTNFTSQVSFPGEDGEDGELEDGNCCFDTGPPNQHPCPTVSSLSNAEGEPAQLESKPIISSISHATESPHSSPSNRRACKNKQLSSDLMEMEPDTMEFKSVTELLSAASPIVLAVRCRVDPEGKESCRQPGHDEGCVEEAPFSCHMFLSGKEEEDKPHEVRSADLMGTDQEAPLSGETQGQKSQSESPEGQSSSHLFRGGDGNGGIHSALVGMCPPPPQRADTNSEDDFNAEFNIITQDPQAMNNGCLALAIQKGISLSYENLLRVSNESIDTVGSTAIRKTAATPREPSGFNLRGCSPGLVGRLSSSTLRGKIQSLPWYLSRSQETVSNWDCQPHSSQTDKITTQVIEIEEDLAEMAEEATEITTEEMNEVDKEERTEITEVFEFTKFRPSLEVQANPKSTIQSGKEHTDPSCVCGVSENYKSRQPQPWLHPCPQRKAGIGYNPELVLGNPSVPEEPQTVVEVCGCQSVYTNCFTGVVEGSGFDEELTVYQFSCQSKGMDEAPLMTTPPTSSSSSFARGGLSPSPFIELSPLLSPLGPLKSCPAESLEVILNRLRNSHYRLPGGFASLQQDIGELLALLEGVPQGRGKHHQEMCVGHFSEDRCLLRAEARKLMAVCQRVTRVGQSPEEMLLVLTDSFHTLVQLVSVCLWFSSCSRCERRQAQVLDSLREISRTYEEFVQVAERAGGSKSCHDLIIKLLARQCTTLTASIFCLTQLFRTLTAL